MAFSPPCNSHTLLLCGFPLFRDWRAMFTQSSDSCGLRTSIVIYTHTLLTSQYRSTPHSLHPCYPTCSLPYPSPSTPSSTAPGRMPGTASALQQRFTSPTHAHPHHAPSTPLAPHPCHLPIHTSPHCNCNTAATATSPPHLPTTQHPPHTPHTMVTPPSPPHLQVAQLRGGCRAPPVPWPCCQSLE